MNQTDKSNGWVEGQVVYLLLLVILVQTIYPITESNSILSFIVYQLLYAGLILIAIVLARQSPHTLYTSIASGMAWVVFGAIYAFNQDATWAQFLAYGTILPLQIFATKILLQYIFKSHVVTRDVLMAAVAVYFLLGAIFVPVYGMIETLEPGSLQDSSYPDADFVPWQHIIYYSYSTLTTLGYGDILPISMWARSASSVEAIIGVLYLTIIMARLVSLYISQIDLEEFKRLQKEQDE